MIEDATPQRLMAGCAANHVDWMSRLARGSGGSVQTERGLTWTDVARANREVSVAVTEPPEPARLAHLIELLEYCRRNRVDRIGYWALATSYRDPLAGWLGARGFRTGGRPHWMYLDLHLLADLPPLAELGALTGVAVTDEFVAEPDSPLPCFHPDTAAVRAAMAAERPRRVWHGIQSHRGRPVGQISICATPGELGVCGLHDTVVIPGERVKGIGRTRLDWVCRLTADLGCRYLVTNAAEGNGPLFEVWGFRTLGFGLSWWLAGPPLRDGIAPRLVEYAEAIAAGDPDRLESAVAAVRPDLDAPLPNRMTPLQFAGATGRADAARWLLAHGAEPDPLAAWDLGWKAETARLLASDPRLLNGRRAASGKTLLHLAVERDDVELVELLLAAGIDTTVTDHRFGGTALDWARVLRRPQVAGALLRHAARTAPIR